MEPILGDLAEGFRGGFARSNQTEIPPLRRSWPVARRDPCPTAHSASEGLHSSPAGHRSTRAKAGPTCRLVLEDLVLR